MAPQTPRSGGAFACYSGPMRLRWLIYALCIAGLLAAVHWYATEHFLYWRFRWFDTPMHLLGGATIGTLAVAVLGRFRPWLYLSLIVLAAVGWELFESAAGIAVLPGVDYGWDTAHDLLNDALGGIAVYAIARFTVWRSA